MLGSKHKMADGRNDGHNDSAGNKSYVFDDLDDFIPSFNEDGSSSICQECGYDIFTSVVICSNDLCRAYSDGPAVFHSECVDLRKDTCVGDAILVEEKWFCPKCRSVDDVSCSEAPTESASPKPADQPEEGMTKRKRKDGQDQSSQQQRKKVSVKRPTAVYTYNDVVANTLMYVLQILASLKTHSIYSRPIFPNSKIIQDLGSKLQSSAGFDSFINFWNWTGERLWQIITSTDKRVLSCHSYEVIFESFDKFRKGLELENKWDKLLHDIGAVNVNQKVSSILLQFCLRLLNEKIMTERNKVDSPEETSMEATQLSSHDHQVINYIAGFVPFALIKKFSKVNSTMATNFVSVLKSWKLNDVHGETFVTYARDWMQKQNKGYLFQPSWELHVFFRTLEYVGRKVLTTSKIAVYKDQSLQTLLVSMFEQNKTVQKRWCELIKDELAKQESEKLFQIILRYWVKIRCNAYVKVYIDMRKARDKDISKKGSKGLRKTVDKA